LQCPPVLREERSFYPRVAASMLNPYPYGPPRSAVRLKLIEPVES
jgi:hypothetical protein